ncbi:MAG TPA: R3H domain-containing nucleic acid-binding protein [Pyrinomonadaceae bacterium]|nr:R3H domain-containing nucleic acid-binding protein [Pyrinomonadaceae bacterium]
MNETYTDAAEFLQSVFRQTGLDLSVSLEEVTDGAALDLDGRDAELLLAEGGEALEAIQHLVNQAFGRKLERGERLVCDVRGFRATREAELRAMAQHAASQVRASGQPFTFGAMNSNERRILHLTLADSTDLQTESIGEAKDRRLKVTLKSPAN